MTTAGDFVRSLEPESFFFSDVRGLEYDASTDHLFVSQLGNTEFPNELLRIDASSVTLEAGIRQQGRRSTPSATTK